MNYNFTSSGSVQVSGCPSISSIIFVTYKFKIGSKVYRKDKALKGIMEPVAIKAVTIKDSNHNMYVDTFNSLWAENELLWVSEAKAVALAYSQMEMRRVENSECRTQ